MCCLAGLSEVARIHQAPQSNGRPRKAALPAPLQFHRKPADIPLPTGSSTYPERRRPPSLPALWEKRNRCPGRFGLPVAVVRCPYRRGPAPARGGTLSHLGLALKDLQSALCLAGLEIAPRHEFERCIALCAGRKTFLEIAQDAWYSRSE